MNHCHLGQAHHGQAHDRPSRRAAPLRDQTALPGHPAVVGRASGRWRFAVLIWVLFSTLCAGCASVSVEQLPTGGELPLLDAPGVMPEARYLIRPGDDLDVKFFYNPELNEAVKVRPDGYITLQLVDDVMAAGRSVPELSAELSERYAVYMSYPVLSVIVRSFQGFRAYVGGEVASPQVIALDGGMSALQGIYAAGGTLSTAYPQAAILIRRNPVDGRPLPYHLDLSEAAIAAGKPDLQVALAPSDVLYIPRSPIANANRWVQQYIADLILFRGINFGFNLNYEIDRIERR